MQTRATVRAFAVFAGVVGCMCVATAVAAEATRPVNRANMRDLFVPADG